MGLAMIPAALNMKRYYRPMFERMLAAWPPGLRQSLIDYHLRNWRKSLQEAANLQGEVLGEIGEGGALPDVPLVVLTAMGIDPFQGGVSGEGLPQRTQRRGSACFTTPSPPRRRAARTARSMPVTAPCTQIQPGAVVGAIRDVVTAARQPTLPLRSGVGREGGCNPLAHSGVGQSINTAKI